MAIENKPGQGVMFPNDQQGNPNRPAWRGSININGKEWEVSAWEKVSQRGARYLSLEAREPWQPQQQGQTQQRQYAPQQQRPAPAPQYTQQRPPQQNYKQGNAPAPQQDPFAEDPF